MSDTNWQCKEGDPFALVSPDTLEHLPSHHCAGQPEIDPRFAAAHYGHDLTPVPDCGACQGDGSICKTSCKVAEESPPVARDIKDLLMDYRQFDNDGVTVVVSREVMHSAADRIATLESEAEQLRMSVHNARIDANRYQWLRDSNNQRHEDDICVSDAFFETYFGDELDAAIDAAMTKDAA